MKEGRAKIEYDDEYTGTRRKLYCDEEDVTREIRSLEAAKFSNIKVTVKPLKESHSVRLCFRVEGTAHYSYKNWSFEYGCPTCGRSARFNINFLGNRRVFCNGVRFLKVKREV